MYVKKDVTCTWSIVTYETFLSIDLVSFIYFTIIAWEHWLMGFMHPVLMVLEKKRVEDRERAQERAKEEAERKKK